MTIIKKQYMQNFKQTLSNHFDYNNLLVTLNEISFLKDLTV